jgi:hypothetical protein
MLMVSCVSVATIRIVVQSGSPLDGIRGIMSLVVLKRLIMNNDSQPIK